MYGQISHWPRPVSFCAALCQLRSLAVILSRRPSQQSKNRVTPKENGAFMISVVLAFCCRVYTVVKFFLTPPFFFLLLWSHCLHWVCPCSHGRRPCAGLESKQVVLFNSVDWIASCKWKSRCICVCSINRWLAPSVYFQCQDTGNVYDWWWKYILLWARGQKPVLQALPIPFEEQSYVKLACSAEMPCGSHLPGVSQGWETDGPFFACLRLIGSILLYIMKYYPVQHIQNRNV